MLKKTEFAGSAGDATVAMDGEAVVAVEISLEGTLQSYRDKGLQSRNTQCRERKIREAGGVWLQKVLSLGVKLFLVKLQRQCGLERACVNLEATIARKRKIRDFKDLIAGFDHMILDPLVRAGVLIDDDFGNLKWSVTQVEDAHTVGTDHVILTFSQGTAPCRESVTKQILEFGWPDPEFRMRNKQDRRREIKERLEHAKA